MPKRAWWEFGRSLGILDISDSSVQWINNLKKERRQSKNSSSPPRWWTVLGVADDRINAGSPAIRIKPSGKRRFLCLAK